MERVDSNRRYYVVSDLFSSIVAQIANVMALLPIISKGLESVESIGEVLCANDIEDNWKKEKVKEVEGEIEFDVSFVFLQRGRKENTK